MAHLVLVADDDDRFSVAEAATGNQALAKVKSSRPQVDLLLTDLHMPDMDGLQLLTEAKRIDPQLPVIAMSGSFSGRLLDLCRHLRRAHARKTFQTCSAPRVCGIGSTDEGEPRFVLRPEPARGLLLSADPSPASSGYKSRHIPSF